MRYYLYISDSKVDMLLQQVASAFAVPDRVARLERVVRHLDNFGDVGSIQDPGHYVRGRLPMRWGPPDPARTSWVYFGGSTDRTVVGLGGATGHVIGASAPAAAELGEVFAPSSLPGLLAGLAAALTVDGNAMPSNALASVYLANRQLRGAEQNVEFLAKRLLHGPSPYPELDANDGMTVLLGSPLFVALAD
jgi:hypothetical protein